MESKMSTSETESSKTQSPKSFLYTTLAKTHLGENSSIIISKLISFGRLSSKELSIKTKLSLKQVKTSLVSLIQLKCVLYWTDNKTIYYQFNESGILSFLYSGDIINHIKDRYDEDYAEIIQNVLQVGHLKISDYLKTITDPEKALQIEDIFYKLYTDGWLFKLMPFHFNPITDLWQKVYNDCMKQIPRSSVTSEVKRVQEAQSKAKIELLNLLESGLETSKLFSVDGGIRKLNPTTIVSFSLSRFQKHTRAVSLANLAKSRVGPLSAAVYTVALGLIEKSSPDLKHPFLEIPGLITDPDELRMFHNTLENDLIEKKKITFNVRDMVKKLPSNLDLRKSIIPRSLDNPTKRVATNSVDEEKIAKKVKTEFGTSLPSSNNTQVLSEEDIEEHEDEDNDGFEFNDDSDPHSITLITHHLKLLATNSVPFVIETNPGIFCVPFDRLTNMLKRFTYDALIKSIFGTSTVRVLRCIRENRLVDEKTLSNTVLLKEKTVRNELYNLFKFNSVEIQEVPRSADRAASKTFFLFRHKEFMSYQFLADALCYNMAEILTRVDEMKDFNKILLQKCEREDVKGREEELLLDLELKSLRDIQNREISSMGRLHRTRTLYEVFGTF